MLEQITNLYFVIQLISILSYQQPIVVFLTVDLTDNKLTISWLNKIEKYYNEYFNIFDYI